MPYESSPLGSILANWFQQYSPIQMNPDWQQGGSMLQWDPPWHDQPGPVPAPGRAMPVPSAAPQFGPTAPPGPPPDPPLPDPPLHPMSQQDQALWEYGENQMPVPPPPAEPWSEQWVDERYPGPYGEAALVKDVVGSYPHEIEAQRAEQERIANQPGPMEQYLSAYDTRTNDIVSQMEASDKRNRLLQMASGVLNSDVGDYTGAMGSVFDVQAQYNQRPAEMEAFRAQRDTGKLDDLYKMAQARKSAQGPQLPAKLQMQLAMAESQEDIDRIMGMAPEGFKYQPWGGGSMGGYRYDAESGEAWLPSMDEPININTPEGNALWTHEMIKAGATSPARMKAAATRLSEQEEWDRMVGYYGEAGATLFGATEPADRDSVYRASVAAVYADAGQPMPESLDVREEWRRIVEAAEGGNHEAELSATLQRHMGQ